MSNLPVVSKNDREAPHELTQLVSFVLDNEEYGLEVLKVCEIIRMVKITCMPNVPDYIEGIINLRGKVIPIISMRKRFGLSNTESNNQTRVIILDVTTELLGFTVDAVSEVIRISSNEIQPPPSIVANGIDHEFITGVINHGEKMLILLNLDMMFSQQETQMFSGI